MVASPDSFAFTAQSCPEYYTFDLKSCWHLIVFLQLSLVPLKMLVSVQAKKTTYIKRYVTKLEGSYLGGEREPVGQQSKGQEKGMMWWI